METTEENNKKLVLEAFDTLFNKRDYAAAERYWSPHYIRSYLPLSLGPRAPTAPAKSLKLR
jgi:predicted SnoaL-like aldol condensation-catalyzing enzyme